MGVLVALLFALAACIVHAAEDPLLDALSLPSASPQTGADWNVVTELSAGRSTRVEGGRAQQIFSLDVQGDTHVAPNLRAVLSDRLDVNWDHAQESRRSTNTVRDMYLSWQPTSDRILDVGLVNLYNGAAMGFNPTDFFKAGSLRSIVSIDPAAIKANRQGSVMLRGQSVWVDSSLTLLYSPKLTDHIGDSNFYPDWGMTNGRDRGLLIYSKKFGENWNPQWLLYKDGGAPLQAGMNLTRLLNDSTVAYLEWSGCHCSQLLDQALGTEGRLRWRHRASTGFTYTTSNKFSVTLEYEYSGAGLNQTQWATLPAKSMAAYASYLAYAANTQDMMTRRGVFAYAKWQDVGLDHLDVSGLVRYNADDHSRISWMEMRYKWPLYEFAVQWQKNQGSAYSEYGVQPIIESWRVLIRSYF